MSWEIESFKNIYAPTNALFACILTSTCLSRLWSIWMLEIVLTLIFFQPFKYRFSLFKWIYGKYLSWHTFSSNRISANAYSCSLCDTVKYVSAFFIFFLCDKISLHNFLFIYVFPVHTISLFYYPLDKKWLIFVDNKYSKFGEKVMSNFTHRYIDLVDNQQQASMAQW